MRKFYLVLTASLFLAACGGNDRTTERLTSPPAPTSDAALTGCATETGSTPCPPSQAATLSPAEIAAIQAVVQATLAAQPQTTSTTTSPPVTEVRSGWTVERTDAHCVTGGPETATQAQRDAFHREQCAGYLARQHNGRPS
jgi:hypothetical protein